jgi:tetratricopeptide (TPR) repeat protein
MDDTTLSTFSELLKAFRKQHKITQQALATQLGVHRNTIGTWENGDCLPDSKAVVLELARLLHLDTHNTRRLLEASLTALSPYWQMPYQRNPFFTGRDHVLQQLHDTLAHERSALISQSYALSGLGGIGKTQTAIEYAYRYANDYAGVFWISAETNESIVSSFVAIAELLNLPEKQEKEQSRVMAAVTRWLTSHSDWLLIFDNVEDLELVKSVLPSARSGSLLFTSRRQTLGFTAHTLDLEQMTPEEGMRFLLHRARLLAPTASLDSLSPEDEVLAREIVTVMAGLPLALDQAGAYVETTQCSLSDYLQLFRSSQLRLLDERDSHADHPSSVIRTFALAFEQLERNNPAAAELLTVCAFLAPEAIPETFFIEGAAHLGPTFEKLAADPLEFQNAIKALLAYSLIQRNAVTKTVTMHRLVQMVLKGRQPEATQHIWITRVVHAMAQIFPLEKEQTNYLQVCEQLLPHALTCVTHCNQWVRNQTLCIALMIRIAAYHAYRARFMEAELLYQQTLDLCTQVLHDEHSLTAEVLLRLGTLYMEQGRFEKAKSLLQRGLHIREHLSGSKHSDVADALNRIATLYSNQNKYEEAKLYFQRALRIREQVPDSKFAASLNSLANLYARQGKYEEAEPLLQRALQIWEEELGPMHIQTSYPIYNLAFLYFNQGKYTQAEPLFQRALYINEQALGPEHHNVSIPLNGMAELYREQGKYEEAERLYQRVLHISEQTLAPDHHFLAEVLHGMAILYLEQSRYENAEPLLWRALQMRERTLGPDHPQIAESLTGLGRLSFEQGKYEQAEPLLQRALQIGEQTFNPEHPLIADTLYHLARFHQLQKHTTEALSLYQQALTIREKALGPQHPKTNATRTAYTNLLRELGREEEAMAIENQVVEITIEA